MQSAKIRAAGCWRRSWGCRWGAAEEEVSKDPNRIRELELSIVIGIGRVKASGWHRPQEKVAEDSNSVS